MLNFLILSFLILFNCSFASEIDSFSALNKDTKNSINILNDETNKRLSEAAKKVQGCDFKKLRKQVFKNTGKGFLVSNIERKGNRLDDKYTHSIKFKDSIYKKSGLFFKSPAYIFFGLGKTLKVNDYIIGTDKLGHFFHEGYLYQNKMLEDSSIEEALDFGIKQEESYYGLGMTGVFSYADLVANFNGLRFWTALTQIDGLKPIDPLTHEELEPYFKCIDNQWKLTKKFDWEQYIDHGWEEHINCNDYDSDKNKHVVSQNISDLLRNSKLENHQCPVIEKDCKDLSKKYGPFSEYLLNPLCMEYN